MSRPILDITLRLPDGKTVTGKSRNVPATIERLYNASLPGDPKRHLQWIVGLGNGPDRYMGAHNVQLGYRKGGDTILDEMVEVEVIAPQ